MENYEFIVTKKDLTNIEKLIIIKALTREGTKPIY